MKMTAAQLTERLSRIAPGAPKEALGLEARTLLNDVRTADELGYPFSDAQLEEKIQTSLTRLERDARDAAQAAALAAQYQTP